MVEYKQEGELTALFKCLSDETRRSLLVELCQNGPYRVTDLAGLYSISLNAISKHLKILEKCSLITRNTEGRVHWLKANLDEIRKIELWLDDLRSIWDIRLERLTNLIESEKQND